MEHRATCNSIKSNGVKLVLSAQIYKINENCCYVIINRKGQTSKKDN